MHYVFEEYSPRLSSDWSRLNLESEEGSLFHTPLWKDILERSFGLRSTYYLVYDDGEPVALCPWFEWSMMKLKGLVSLPESDLNNVIIKRPSDRGLVRFVINMSGEMARERGLGFLLLSCRDRSAAKNFLELGPLDGCGRYPFPVNGTMSLDLEKTPPDVIWNKVFSKKDGQRKYIKRFEEAGFEIIDRPSKESLAHFYRYYSENLNHIGARPYGLRHFEVLFDRLPPEMIRMTLLQRGDRVAGGLIAFRWPERKIVYIRYLALNRGLANTFHPPIYLYWDMVKHAYEDGYQKICFGSSPRDIHDKNYKIKAGFGCIYEELFGGFLPLSRVYDLLFRSYRAGRRGLTTLRGA